MHNFWKGLILAFMGFVVWFLPFSLAQTQSYIYGEHNPNLSVFILVGFLIMTGGPIVFWILKPLEEWTGRRSP